MPTKISMKFRVASAQLRPCHREGVSAMRALVLNGSARTEGVPMRSVAMTVVVGLALVLVGCADAGSRPSPGASEPLPASQEPVTANSAQQSSGASAAQKEDEGKDAKMKLNIDGTDVDVAWEDNQAVAELRTLAVGGPIIVELHRYGGFEQVGPLGTSLAADDVQMTTEPGDIVLYAGDQISIFYGANSWAYTRLGHITDRTTDELAQLLGNGAVIMTITVE